MYDETKTRFKMVTLMIIFLIKISKRKSKYLVMGLPDMYMQDSPALTPV